MSSLWPIVAGLGVSIRISIHFALAVSTVGSIHIPIPVLVRVSIVLSIHVSIHVSISIWSVALYALSVSQCFGTQISRFFPSKSFPEGVKGSVETVDM